MAALHPENAHATEMPSIIVVGGGLAGLSASIHALRHGAHVTLVEKEAAIGGNSAKATRQARLF
jgi:phytoene dehydrogenase-like protein